MAVRAPSLKVPPTWQSPPQTALSLLRCDVAAVGPRRAAYLKGADAKEAAGGAGGREGTEKPGKKPRRTGSTRTDVESGAPTLAEVHSAPASCYAELLSFGCPVLDAAAGGGVPVGSLTELAGESAAGKTQLCLQLALAAQRPGAAGGLGGAAVYVTTEGDAPMRRLDQLASSLPGELPPSPRDNIFVERAGRVAELLAIIARLRVFVRQRAASGRPIRLVVVDSIAAVIRVEFSNTVKRLTDRAGAMFKIAAELKALAHEFRLAVVVVNQATDVFTAGDSVRRFIQPSLGLSWASAVNTRIVVSRADTSFVSRDNRHRVLAQAPHGGGASADDGGPRPRRMELVFSSFAPSSWCEYRIHPDGVSGIDAAYVTGDSGMEK